MGVQNSKHIYQKKQNDDLQETDNRSNVLVTKTTSINDNYILYENVVLGEGGNGKVLMCMHKKTKKKYALKVLFYLICTIFFFKDKKFFKSAYQRQ